MKFIKSSFQILDPTGYTINDIYKLIELAGRTCYLSYDKITDDSARKFVDMIGKRGHTAVYEQGTVYLKIPKKESYGQTATKYAFNPYSLSNVIDGDYYITTNYRVLYQGGFGRNWLDDLKYLCEPTEHHEKRISVKFILPISIAREFIRHRTFSFCEQSTRYVDFSKEKFGSEITFIIPHWANLQEASYTLEDGDWVENIKGKLPNKILKHCDYDATDVFLSNCSSSEANYKVLTLKGCKAQEAREVLPLCTKTELVMTGTVSQWEAFFKLRCDKAAHPQARELAIPLQEEFIKRQYV